MPTPSNIIIAIDFGHKKIGIAVGNMISQTATPIGKFNLDIFIKQELIRQLVNDWNPSKIIIGYPVSATENKIHRLILKFKSHIESLTELVVILTDESFSTEEAKSMVNPKKAPIDALAACIIAEQWMRNQ